MLKIFLFIFTLIINVPAYAYLGPGIGGGILLATFGIIVAVFAGIFGIFWFPIKKLLKKKIKNKDKKID